MNHTSEIMCFLSAFSASSAWLVGLSKTGFPGVLIPAILLMAETKTFELFFPPAS